MDNQYHNNKNNQPKMPKFNMNWIYELVIVVLVVLVITGGGNLISPSNASKKTDYTSFQQYVAKGFADKVVLNKENSTLKMYVKPEHIREVFHSSAKQTGTSPYLEVEFGDVSDVEKFLTAERQAGKLSKFSYENEKGSDIWNILLNISFPVFLIVMWIFLSLIHI